MITVLQIRISSRAFNSDSGEMSVTCLQSIKDKRFRLLQLASTEISLMEQHDRSKNLKLPSELIGEMSVNFELNIESCPNFPSFRKPEISRMGFPYSISNALNSVFSAKISRSNSLV